MLVSLIPPRLHGWLDELATLTYLVVAFAFGFHGASFFILIAAALVHFTNTRLSDYPQGTFKCYPMRTHAVIELVEGTIVLASGFVLLDLSGTQKGLVLALGAAQIGAALL